MKKIKLIIALCLSTCIGFAQIIYTAAGTGTYGYSGDGGFAASAKINGPNGIIVDASGNIYFSDMYNFRIRKVNTKGIISTMAGTGVNGYNGDGIPATSAKISYAQDLAIDASGNIYFSDQYNSRIRKITISTGLVSTVAGTGVAGAGADGIPATSSQIDQPYGITLDASGNIYFIDFTFRVRKVTVSTGIISTVAGNGTPGYNGDGIPATPAKINAQDVAVDSYGNIYIADTDNYRIRKVTASTGIISTVAGTGTGGYNGDGIPATSAQIGYVFRLKISSDGRVLYFTDNDNGNSNSERIRTVILADNLIRTIAGTTIGYSGDGGPATSAKINAPTGLDVDGLGNIYFGDAGNYRLRAISSKCPANAGPNVTDRQNNCAVFLGVQIGTPTVPNMTYLWSPSTALNATNIAQPTSVWSNTNSPKVYSVTVSNSNCISNTSQVTVSATLSPCTCPGCSVSGRLINPSEADPGTTIPVNFSVYPNPSNGNIAIGVYDNAQYIRIMDMQGKVVFETKNTNAGELRIDISNYTKGIYIVTAKIGDTIEKQKLVVE